MQMPRRRWIVSALSVAVLTACGGGGGNGFAFVPTLSLIHI